MSQTTDPSPLLLAGHRAVREGRLAEGRRLFEQVLRADPRHGEALYTLGFLAFQTGDLKVAHELLLRTVQVRERDPLAHTTLAVVLRELNDPGGERAALTDALSIDPYYMPALLSLGAWQERNGYPRAAADTYRNALKIAPDDQRWPPELRDHLAHARTVTERNAAALHAHLEQATEAARARHQGADFERAHETMSILAGRSRPYVHEPIMLHVPRLPAIPFYPRADFPFLAGLEAQTDAIRAELLAGLRDLEGFAPYVQYPPGVPVNQWAELNYSDKWSSLFLWQDGLPVAENHKRFPKTAAALAALPMANLEGFCPTAMFSALKPGARIPPHTGETNARLIVHLPLVIPPNCSYRVGYEWRRWVEGECLVFDDSIEHEARNDSDQMRIVLIFDIWNPYLTLAERDVVSTALNAARGYYAAG
ncbi:MAG: aspartyl/asparaginyl beta-hydroxylase domain-containing protein [Alphaproteobacteria bacterium]|nr:aspartyl/asparaginyl beta-hydroxylase domain-containing protein [Alphaproteobacteria bacterium]